MRRGEVWTANLNLSRAGDPGKIRPVLIVQADWLTASDADTVIIVPLSTQSCSGLEPLRTHLPARDRLRAPSVTLIEKVRALDRGKFGVGPLAIIDDGEMRLIEQQLRLVLGIAD